MNNSPRLTIVCNYILMVYCLSIMDYCDLTGAVMNKTVELRELFCNKVLCKQML